MDERQNITLCSDMSGRLIGQGDNVLIPSKGTGKVYKVIDIMPQNCIIDVDGNKETHPANTCIKVV